VIFAVDVGVSRQMLTVCNKIWVAVLPSSQPRSSGFNPPGNGVSVKHAKNLSKVYRAWWIIARMATNDLSIVCCGLKTMVITNDKINELRFRSPRMIRSRGNPPWHGNTI
jgi:hypothetical protein